METGIPRTVTLRSEHDGREVCVMIPPEAFAVLDVETTGLSAEHHRVVEIAIVLVRPGHEPEVVLDTLVRPRGRVTATEIHGIADEDLAGAPEFGEIAGAIVAALANRVLCSHNIQFDRAHLDAELQRCGYWIDIPQVCSMLLPRVVDRAVPPLSLARACERWGVHQAEAHAAANDAMACALLLRRHIRALREDFAVRTFGQLAQRGDHLFLQSLARPMLQAPPSITRSALKPRGARPARGRRPNIAEYMEALLDPAADLRLTDAEVADLRGLSSRLQLDLAEVRAVHAKVFFGMIGRYVEDARLDELEARHLAAMLALLQQLGWAPGDVVAEG
ncbi:MAG: 3'-5' exonuclease [Myxococcales bacterium]|nr:3'-5' exonuclease [Myxococcales bacterium]